MIDRSLTGNAYTTILDCDRYSVMYDGHQVDTSSTMDSCCIILLLYIVFYSRHTHHIFPWQMHQLLHQAPPAPMIVTIRFIESSILRSSLPL